MGSFASTSKSFLSQNAPDVGEVCALAFFMTLSISLLLPAGKLGSIKWKIINTLQMKCQNSITNDEIVEKYGNFLYDTE